MYHEQSDIFAMFLLVVIHRKACWKVIHGDVNCCVNKWLLLLVIYFHPCTKVPKCPFFVDYSKDLFQTVEGYARVNFLASFYPKRSHQSNSWARKTVDRLQNSNGSPVWSPPWVTPCSNGHHLLLPCFCCKLCSKSSFFSSSRNLGFLIASKGSENQNM